MTTPARDGIYRHRGLELDAGTGRLRRDGEEIALTPAQLGILRALFEAAGRPVERDVLAAAACAGSARAVDLHISRLRRRLDDRGPSPRYIESLYGRGYRLAIASDRPWHGDARSASQLMENDDPVILVDSRFRIRAANRAAERSFGGAAQRLLGRRCGDALGCRAPDGTKLDGPGCLERFVIAADGSIADVSACVDGREGPVDVRFAHRPVRTASETLLAIFVTPSADTFRRPLGSFGPPEEDARMATAPPLRRSVEPDRGQRTGTHGGDAWNSSVARGGRPSRSSPSSPGSSLERAPAG